MSLDESNPLKGLERLIGGRWYYVSAEDVPLSYHVYESKLDGKLITSNSYAVGEDEDSLVTEALWYYNPAEKRVKALGVAQHMDVSVFEYTEITFEENTMTCVLIAYNDEGSSHYIETWEFPDADRYDWTLSVETPEGLQKVMGAAFERKA